MTDRMRIGFEVCWEDTIRQESDIDFTKSLFGTTVIVWYKASINPGKPLNHLLTIR